MEVLLLWLLLVESAGLLAALKLSPVSEDVDLQNVFGQVAAFADFNSDKATDILVLNSTGQRRGHVPRVFIMNFG